MKMLFLFYLYQYDYIDILSLYLEEINLLN